MPKNSALTRWAHDFVAREKVDLLPVDSEKAPFSRRFSDKTQRRDILASWFNNERYPNGGAAVACGFASNLIAIDCDVPKDHMGRRVPGRTGDEQFIELCELNGDRPSPVSQSTPSGGRHYFYRYREGVRNRAKIYHNGRKLLIDVRSDNGYVVVAKSDMDINEFRVGKEDQLRGYDNLYRRDPLPDGSVPLLSEAPDLPDWLFRLFTEKPRGDEDSVIAAGLERVRLCPEGSRNTNLFRVCTSLFRYFYDSPDRIAEIAEGAAAAARESGLGDREIASTIRSARNTGLHQGQEEGRGDLPYYFEAKVARESCEWTECADEDGKGSPYAGLLPPFPIWTLDRKLRHIVEQSARGLGVPTEMAFGALLGLGSACIGRARGVVYAASTNWVEYGNLFIMIISETGNGKSPTVRFYFEHLREIESAYKKSWKATRREYEQKMIQWKKEQGGKEKDREPAPVAPINVQFILDDITMEAAVERLEDNPRGLFWDVDEMSGWLQGLDRYNKNGSGEGKKKILSAWDSRHINYARKTNQGVANEIYIRKGTMGILGAIQPYLVRGMFSQNDIKQGLPQRFLYLRTRQFTAREYPPKSMDPSIGAMLACMTENLIFGIDMDNSDMDRRKGREIGFSPDALALLNDYLNHLEKFYFGSEFHAYAIKMERMVMRMALILHYLRWAASFRKPYRRFGMQEDGQLISLADRNPDMKLRKETAEPLPGEAWKRMDSFLLGDSDPDLMEWRLLEEGDPVPEAGDISCDTMNRAIELNEWFISSTLWVQDILPGDCGGKDRKDASTLTLILAKLIVDRRREIADMEYVVDNQAWDDWLKAAQVNGNQRSIKKSLTELGVRDVRGRYGRGRKITPDTLERCAQMLMPQEGGIEDAKGGVQ